LTDKPTDTSGPDSSTDSLTDGLTIPLTIRPYNLVDQNGWNDPSVRASTVVQSGCLVRRPSLAHVSRIGRSNGKGNPWQGQFLVALFGR